MAYVVCSKQKHKLVIARLTKRQTHKVTFNNFLITGKNIKKQKKRKPE